MSSRVTLDGAKELAGHYFGRLDNSQLQFEMSADGKTAIVRNIPLFRTGSFKDSRGRRHNIDRAFLAALIDNFGALNAMPIHFEPPVRADHSRTIKNVTGYIQDLHFSGNTLYGTAEITEPDAVGKLERRTYRKVSAEIGAYEDNDGNVYEPAFMGVAFVDIPAVEGLMFSKEDEESGIRYFTEAAPDMSDENEKPEGDGADDRAPARRGDAAGAFGAPVNIHIQGAPAQAPATEAPATSTFTIGGVEMTLADIEAKFAAQAQFEQEITQKTRADFVKGLVDANKVAAPQMDAMTAFAQKLDNDAFEDFTKLFEGAPELSLFAQHADGTSNPDNENGDPKIAELKAEYEIALETVEMMRRTQMFTAEALKETDAFKRMEVLKSAVEGSN